MAGINAAHQALGLAPVIFPSETAIGALGLYVSDTTVANFQPMNVNLGIFPRLHGKKIRKRTERCEAYAARSLAAMEKLIAENKGLFPDQ